jgi:hypothetical protein
MMAAKRFILIGRLKTTYPQSLSGSFDGSAFSRPPAHQIENGSQIRIDRIAVALGLAVLPSASPSQEVLAQRLGGVGNVILNRLSQAGRRQPKI